MRGGGTSAAIWAINSSGCERDLVGFGTALVTGGLAVLLGAVVHQGRALLAKAIHGKGWPGRIAQQPLQCGAVVGLYADTGIDQEAAVLVGQHVFGIITTLQQAPAHEGVQDAPTQGGLHLGHDSLIDRPGGR